MKTFLIKNTPAKKTIALILALVSIFAVFVIPAAAAASSMQANISQIPCDRNLSNGPLPAYANDFSVGETAYINLAATTDFSLKSLTINVKTPNQSSFSNILSYRATNFYRWYTLPYAFNAGAGIYVFQLVIYTTSGVEYRGEISVEVKSGSTGGGNIYNYNGAQFRVVPNFRSEYFYNQNNYSRFVNSRGNRGCTATAMCSAWAMKHNQQLSPNSVKWSSEGCYWEYCKRYTSGGKEYRGWSYSQQEALRCAYDSVMNGVPMIVGVGTGSHVVTVVGVRSGANRGSLSFSDLLILDPNGGTVATLAKYSCINREWALRVPV